MAAKKAGDFQGVDIREVFDFRLSLGSAVLFNSGEFWAVKIMSNTAPDGESIVLAEHTTTVPTRIDGVQDPREPFGVCTCYAWLHSVRDQFSRDHIEIRKPVVAMINAANLVASDKNTEANKALADGKPGDFYRLKGEMQAQQGKDNAAVKTATLAMHKQIEELEGA